MEGLEPFEVNRGLPTDFNSLLISLTVNSLCTDELLFLMQVTEFNKYLTRKAYIHKIFFVKESYMRPTTKCVQQLKATVKIFKRPVIHSFSLSETEASQKRPVF